MGRGSHREADTDRHETQIHQDTQLQTDTNRQTHRQTDRQMWTNANRQEQRNRYRQTITDRHTHKHTAMGRETHRQTQTDRHTQGISRFTVSADEAIDAFPSLIIGPPNSCQQSMFGNFAIFCLNYIVRWNLKLFLPKLNLNKEQQENCNTLVSHSAVCE